MPKSEFDPKSLSVEERLALIDRIWLSLAVDADKGDERAQEAVDLHRPLDPDVLAEFVRRADEAERDPSSLIPWERVLAEMRKKHD